MLRILLILLICNNVISNEDESNKYIDLLPEKEKREFLDRIARRILEEIKSKGDPNTSHADISDEQLDAQAAFVQGILKEESENLKKKRRDNKNSNAVEDLQIKIDNKDDNENQDRYIDLTLRTGVRRKRNNTDVVPLESTTELAPQTIFVETVYDQVTLNYTLDNRLSEDFNSKISQTNVSESDIEDATISVSENDTTDRQTHNLGTVKTTLYSTLEQKNLRKHFQDKPDINYRTTLLTDFEPNSEETSSEISAKITTTSFMTESINETQKESNNYNTTLSEPNSIEWGSTQKIYEPEGLTYEHFDKNNNDTTINVGPSTESFATSLLTLSFSTETNTLFKLKTTTEANIKTSTVSDQSNNRTRTKNYLRDNHPESDVFKNENVIMTSNKNVISKKVSDSVSDNFTRDYSYSNKETTMSQNYPLENYKTILNQFVGTKLTTDTEESNTPVNLTDFDKKRLESRTVDTFLFNKSSNGDQIHNRSQKQSHKKILDTKDLKVLVDPKKYLRSDTIGLESDAIETTTSKFKAYEVYEIAPNEPPFLPSTQIPNDEQEEQPHYANIYNYDPSNAYFNPYNRLGPPSLSVEDLNNIKDFAVEDTDEGKKYIEKNSNQSKKTIVRSRFHGYNKKEHFKEPPATYLQPKVTNNIHDFMNIFKKVTSNNAIYFHAYDYPDYYLERANRPRKMYNNEVGFPDSSEYDHPYNFLHQSESIKDHIRAARYLLYLQKRFGYIPQLNQSVSKNKTTVDETAKSKNMRYYQNGHKKRGLTNMSKPSDGSIAMDYYYDRDTSEVLENDYVVSGRELKNNYISRVVPLNEKSKQQKLESNNNNNSKETLANPEFHLKKKDGNEPISYKSMLVVLGDMIQLDNEDLTNYNWLRTTVDIRAAIEKVNGLIDSFHFGRQIHQKDLELLKFVFYLYKSSKLKLEIDDTTTTNYLVRKKGVLPRNKRKRRIKHPLQVMKDYFSFIRDQNINPDDQPFMILHELEDLLNEILFQLDDFHEALKRIAQSSTHRTYNWYNLKKKFFKNATKRNLGQVLLHLAVYNLLDQIDDIARTGLDDGFKPYVKRNPDIVDASRNELLFILHVLQELR